MDLKYTIAFSLSIVLLTNAYPNNHNKISLPLPDRMDASLTARIDTSEMNTVIKDYIDKVVKQQVLASLNETKMEIENELQSTLEGYVTNDRKHMTNYNLELFAKFNDLKSMADKNRKDIEMVIRENEKTEKKSKTVAVTGCVTQQRNEPAGYIIKFDDIISKVGFNGVSNFKTTGKFTAESGGLYLITVDIMSDTFTAEVGIFKNSIMLRSLYLTTSINEYWFTSSGSIAIELSKGDRIWIKTLTSMEIQDSKRSCVTVIKVK